jgi:DNA-nicking Smr family endonuclease
LRRRELRQLRGGKLQPERSIDLHGYDRRAARAFLVAEITAAQAAAEYCVRVIHGRGLRSEEGEAVLKLVLPDWLTSPPLASMVLAFAPAQPRDGGPGACYVLLG